MLIITARTCALSEVEDNQVGVWKKLPLPGQEKGSGRNRYIQNLGVDKDGIPWVIIDQLLYYWDGNTFIKVAGFDARNNNGVYYIIGGNDRDLYLLQPGKDKLHYDAYLLENNKMLFVRDCYMNGNGSDFCPVYVSKAGKLCNWGSRFLAVYSGGVWKKIETSLNADNASIFDFGDKVYFYFNGNLCTIDSSNNITSKDIAIPPNTSNGESAALWGKDTVIVTNRAGTVAAFSLQTGELVTLPQSITDLFVKTNNCGFRSLANGEVLFYHSANQMPSTLKIINTDGQVKSIENLAAQGLSVFQNEMTPLLNAPDGSFWLKSSIGGVIQVMGGSAIVYDWHTAAPMSRIRKMCLGRKNTIYVQSEDGIYVYDPTGNNKQNEQVATHWQDYSISRVSIQDSLGRIWCFLKDHSKEISCWDGNKWTHIPFSDEKLYPEPTMIDDRGHIILSNPRFDTECYVVSLESIKKYNSVEDALVALVAEGSKWFETQGYTGCVVDQSNHILLSGNGFHGVEMWDGKRWTTFSEIPSQPMVLESKKYGFLVYSRDSDNRYYNCTNGQLAPIDFGQSEAGKMLLGPQGIQPFDEELLKQRPYAYIQIDIGSQGNPIIKDPGSNVSYTISNHNYESRGILGKTRSGGFWLAESQSNRVLYTADGEVFPCDFSNLPLSDIKHSNLRFYEDPGNNLWVDAGYYAGKNHLFMYSRPSAQIGFENPPKTAARSVVMKITTDNVPANTKLFWRIDDAPWKLTEDDSLKLDFLKNGRHSVQIKAIDGIGGEIAISKPVQIESMAGFPKTVLVGKGPFSTDDYNWLLPVSGIPSYKGAQMGFTYKIDTGEWMTATDRGEAILGRLSKGAHTISVAAVEDGLFTDPNPVSFEFTYSPNIERIADKLILLLSSQDPGVREKATRELKSAGPEVVLEIRKQLKAVREILNNSWMLDQAMNEMVNR